MRNNSYGNIEVIIIVIVILGASVLVGGQYIFDSLGVSPRMQNFPFPGIGGTNPTNPGGGDSKEVNTPGWEINFISSSCDTKAKAAFVNVTFLGTQNGYYAVAVEKNGVLSQVFSNDFAPPLEGFELKLVNSDGFNTNNWQLQLYEGGSLDTGIYKGGTIKSSKNMKPTECK